jgi:hypothetical protein
VVKGVEVTACKGSDVGCFLVHHAEAPEFFIPSLRGGRRGKARVRGAARNAKMRWGTQKGGSGAPQMELSGLRWR